LNLKILVLRYSVENSKTTNCIRWHQNVKDHMAVEYIAIKLL